MKSSFYFRFYEFLNTDTNLKNCPSTIEQIINIVDLAKVLQQIRVVCGFPVIIESGFRTPQVNSLVGGVSNSKHMDGLAADLKCRNPDEFKKLVDVCKAFYDLKLLKEYIVKQTVIHVAI